MSILARGLSAVLFLMLGACSLMDSATPPTPASTDASADATALATVETLYDLVTFGPGATPDWDTVRALFLDEAVIVLRTSREATTVMSLEDFVADFVRFIEASGAGVSGFEERILDVEVTQFGDIAHVLVLYEPRAPGSEREPTPGVDSIQLVRRDGSWRIASIVNEVLLEGRALPSGLSLP